MEQTPQNKETGITIIATQPRFIPTNGGKHGWWEDEMGTVRLESLRKAYLYGASDKEACYLAGITYQQLHYYCSQINPDFYREKEELKLNTVFNARRIILRAMEKNPEMAWRYLAKKLPQEFGETPEAVINNFGTMNTQINQEYFDVPPNVDELLDGPEIKPAN